jgi:hypothetical protein
MSTRTRGRQFFPLLLFLIGLVFTSLAIDYENFIAILIGITLLFFGSLFTYVAPNIFTKKILLENVGTDFVNISIQLTQQYAGTPYYISPNTIWGLKNCVLFIPKKENHLIPDPEILSAKKIDPDLGIIIDAPGSKLSELYERYLNVSFSSVNLDYLKENLMKPIVDEYELAKKIELSYEFSKITIIIEKNIFEKITNTNNQIIGDPLIGSLACSIAKNTRKPIKIEEIIQYKKENITKLTLRVLD